MLQLLCYAKKLLTVPELFHALTQTDNEEIFPTTTTQAPPVQCSQEKSFERKVLALTGGLLEIFRGYCNGIGETRIFQAEDDYTSENERREHDYINIIHRTVRTYLQSGGWEHVLGRAHEGTLHGEMLWLRVCTRLFPPSFVVLPPGMDKELIPKRMKQDLMPNILSTFQTWSRTSQILDNKHLTAPGPATSLRNYAVLSLLDHASIVEKDLGLSSYAVLKPVLTDNFVCHHRYLGYRRDCVCDCFQHCPEPRHPLHLAIAHGLNGFVGEFLFHFSETTTQDSPEWDDIFYLDTGETPNYQDYSSRYQTSPNRISLLEFALRHANNYRHNSISQMQIVTTLVEGPSRVQDIEMVYALQKSGPKIVQLLLAHWLDRDMVFDIESMRYGCDFEDEINLIGIADQYRRRAHTRPLWHIARRQFCDKYENEELLDIFLEHGEDINGQCGLVGTALHGNLLRFPWWVVGSFEMFKLLIEKGADVNAHGPLGKPLELLWRLAHQCWWEPRHTWRVTTGIKCLIDCGAINEQKDPNGSVPSKEQMLAFHYGSWEHFKQVLRYYEGDGGQNKTDSVD